MSLTKLRRPRSGIPCSYCSTTWEKTEFCVHMFGEERLFLENDVAGVERLLTKDVNVAHLYTIDALDGEEDNLLDGI